jgi:hypothetical protein
MTDDRPKDAEAATDAKAATASGAAAKGHSAARSGGKTAGGGARSAADAGTASAKTTSGGKTTRGGARPAADAGTARAKTASGGAGAAANAEGPTAGAATATDGPETGNDGQAPPPLNREQRRAQKFHRKSGGRQDNLQTQRENNSGFLTTPPALIEEGPKEAVATSTTQGPTHLTGPGTGGATESEERAPHHEGAHQGNPTKG